MIDSRFREFDDADLHSFSRDELVDIIHQKTDTIIDLTQDIKYQKKKYSKLKKKLNVLVAALKTYAMPYMWDTKGGRRIGGVMSESFDPSEAKLSVNVEFNLPSIFYYTNKIAKEALESASIVKKPKKTSLLSKNSIFKWEKKTYNL